MSAPKHTPGPWVQQFNGQIWAATETAPEGALIARAHSTGLNDQRMEANAARIVACVNACEGLADPSVVPEMANLIVRLAAGFHAYSPQLVAHEAQRVLNLMRMGLCTDCGGAGFKETGAGEQYTCRTCMGHKALARTEGGRK